MNAIRQTQALNKRELENAVPPEASWHADYRDTAYIYIGGLPLDLSEGDIITIFSQYGEPVHINLLRDKETGKSRGFAFLKYEDQRSTDLAVDNLGGATVLGRMLRVDHARYKRRDDEEEGDNVARLMGDATIAEGKADGDESRRERRRRSDDEMEERRPLLKEEKELQDLIHNHDDEDPMKEFLIEEKKEEIALALARYKNTDIIVAIALGPRSAGTGATNLEARRDDRDRGRQTVGKNPEATALRNTMSVIGGNELIEQMDPEGNSRSSAPAHRTRDDIAVIANGMNTVTESLHYVAKFCILQCCPAKKQFGALR
ncbi:RNA-binding motif protein, X-linked 2 [Penicillium oxalicum]|uniref:RNA-binding motif protein, X-linked 2 n=1 Tax=Penicillium oxalicum TaxID=69781 RepID=UPI0020B7C0FD|nr:RNA-binding motif protein, X-linked 2 [Penicillium oxalicum]KAI2793596.1 RNA-binding motif protein, X-linked 2 [Penicillium oxalicum]